MGMDDDAGRRVRVYGPRRAARAWSPVQLPLLQMLWLAEQGVGDPPVAAWANQSGSAEANRNLVQPTPAARPTIVTTNDPLFGPGNASVATTAGPQRLYAGYPTPFTCPDVGAITVFCVVRFTNPVGHQFVFQLNPHLLAGPQVQLRLIWYAANNMYLQIANGLDPVLADFYGDLANKTLGIVASYSATVMKLYVNSPTILRATGPIATAGFTVPNRLCALNFDPPGGFGGCAMGMGGMMAGEMTAADRAALFNYWAVTRGYPLAALP